MAAAGGAGAEAEAAGLWDTHKAPSDALIGCTEDPETAFQLFAGPMPAVFGHFGFGTHPHIGVYNSESYDPFLPIVAVSVPAAALRRQLPSSVADVLDAARARGMIGPGAESVEVYALVHSAHHARKCSHHECHNEDEASLQLHAWTFASDDVDAISAGLAINAGVHMGLFEPVGVREVHQALQDGGIAFGRLSKRSVIAHGGRFSPNNANFQLDGTTDFPVFYSVAVDRTLHRAAVCLHLLPRGEGAADRVRGAVRGIHTLRALAPALATISPVFVERLEQLLEPIAGPRAS